ncbi:MAG: DUF4954 family protein, partial [Muribaculaceae bacterium]|nr:DUF4954 family protein [Muribaculaceae bacterium]
PAGHGQWLDLAGMFAPQAEVDRLCSDLEQGRISTLPDLEARIEALARDYYDMEWTWVAHNFRAWAGKTIDQITAADVLALTDRWQKSVVALDQMLLDDARKEFSLSSSTGFGADGRPDTRSEDFRQVRGEFQSDDFVRMVRQHITEKSALADKMRAKLS